MSDWDLLLRSLLSLLITDIKILCQRDYLIGGNLYGILGTGELNGSLFSPFIMVGNNLIQSLSVELRS